MDLLLKSNRIRRHVMNFKIPTPTHHPIPLAPTTSLMCTRHEFMVLFEFQKRNKLRDIFVKKKKNPKG